MISPVIAPSRKSPPKEAEPMPPNNVVAPSTPPVPSLAHSAPEPAKEAKAPLAKPAPKFSPVNAFATPLARP